MVLGVCRHNLQRRLVFPRNGVIPTLGQMPSSNEIDVMTISAVMIVLCQFNYV